MRAKPVKPMNIDPHTENFVARPIFATAVPSAPQTDAAARTMALGSSPGSAEGRLPSGPPLPPGSFPSVGMLPRFFVGTSSMGSVLSAPFLSGAERRSFHHLDGLLELGCCAFDLAASYQLGGTERLLGAWMASRGHRGRLFLATKGALPLPIISPHRLTAKDISADLHDSLRRLRTDYVDLYLLHRDDPGAPLEPVLQVLTNLVREGKIRAWGVSNWTIERISALDTLARSSGVPSIAASSPHFSLAEWNHPPWKGTVSIAGESQRQAREYHLRTALPVLAWSPLGQGFFSAPDAQAGQRTYGNPANLDRRRRAAELARQRQRSVVQIALAYLLNQPFPVYPVVAASTVDKMRNNLEAAAIHLSAQELTWLESGTGSEAQAAISSAEARKTKPWKS